MLLPRSDVAVLFDVYCPRLGVQNGYNKTNLFSHQVDASDPHKAADILLKIASLYSEEPETKTAVLETFGE